jgi:protein arginine kinase activator
MKPFCESCHKAAASVHVTELKDGQKVELQLCEGCAENQGIPPKHTPVSMLEIFKQLMDKTGGTVSARDRACPGCEITFSEFKAKGRFGCAEDYDVFLSRVVPLLERIHGSSEHATDPGESVISGADQESMERAELARLHRDLARTVKEEEYEMAAQIRDRIRVLEEQLHPESHAEHEPDE